MEGINYSAFPKLLLLELMNSLGNWYGSDNWDADRFGSHKDSSVDWLLSKLKRFRKFLPAKPIVIPGAEFDRWNRVLSKLDDHMDGFSWLYEHLQDEYSKSLLVKVVAYWIMGYRKIKLPKAIERNIDTQYQLIRSLIKSADVMVTSPSKWKLNHYDLSSIGYPIECFLASPIMFTLRQYDYDKRKPSISASPGDIVIDGGGCWGDTALFFSQLIGEQGKVFSFEFVPENLKVFRRNLDLNPQLASRIQIVPSALYDQSDSTLDYVSHGPSTSPLKELPKEFHDKQSVLTITIDDFVKKEGLARVDFIKMDIEGSELKALQGAENTLRTFKPRLAICLYHSPSDFRRIPQYLDELNLSYQFYLDHFTIHKEETVLFADPVIR